MGPELQGDERITILLAADDVLVRNFLSAALTREGYLVRSAADSGEALELAPTFSGGLHILLSCLPAADGIKLAQGVLETHSQVRAIVASPSMRSFLAELAGPAILLYRPAVPVALADAIRRALNSACSGTYIVIDPKL